MKYKLPPLVAALSIFFAAWIGWNLQKGNDADALRPVAETPAVRAAVELSTDKPSETEIAVAEQEVSQVTSKKSSEATSHSPTHEAACIVFRQWLHSQNDKFIHSADTEGRNLLTRRRESMAWLIRNDPGAAIEQALSYAERKHLPDEWLDSVEERFSTIAQLDVLPDCSPEGGSNTHLMISRAGFPVLRGLAWGAIRDYLSKERLPVEGIALDGWVAIAENGLRIVEGAELAAAEEIFPYAQLDSSPISSVDTAVTALVGGGLCRFDTVEAAKEMRDLYPAIASLPGPHSAGPYLTAAADGSPYEPGEILQDAEDLASSWTETPKKVLVLNTVFPDNTTPVGTQAQWQAVMSEVSNWLAGSSYGKTHLIVTVPPDVFKLPSPGTFYQPTDNYWQIMTDAKTLALASGYDPANFDITVVAFPGLSVFWAGRASLGGGNHWLNGTRDAGVISHEFGHNYGLWHASSWDANDGSVLPAAGAPDDTDPRHNEYGDPYSIMGYSGSYPKGDFCPHGKSRLNWIPAAQVETVSTSGIYRIHRFDQPNANANPKLALKLQRAESQTFWIGYRRNLKTNNYLSNGAYVTWGYRTDKGRLIDLTPESSNDSYNDKEDAALAVGSTFSEPTGSIYITTVAQGGSEPNEWLDVRVEFQANRAPSASIILPQGVKSVLTPLTFTANASDPDGDTLNYTWNFADGSVSSGNPMTHTFLVGGNRQVRLRVTDGRGAVTEVTEQLVIDDPLQSWTNITPTALQEIGWKSAVCGNGKAVAVGYSGSAYAEESSVTKPSDWTRSSLPIHATDVSWRNQGFVAVGQAYDGSVWRSAVSLSSDGQTWGGVQLFDATRLDAIASSSSAYVAVGWEGVILRSTDGMHWERKNSGTSNWLSSVAFAGDCGLVVSSNEEYILLSEDSGLTWHAITPPVTGSFYPRKVFSVGNLLFLSAGARMAIYNPKTRTWTETNIAGNKIQLINSLTKHDAVYVGMATSEYDQSIAGHHPLILVSLDGLSWECAIYEQGTNITCLLSCDDALLAFTEQSILANIIEPPALAVNPSAMLLTRAAGETGSLGNVQLSNTGFGTIEWTATPSVQWLTCLPATGIASTAPTTVNAILAQPLVAGTHAGSIVFQAEGVTPQTVTVTVNVYEDEHGNDISTAAPVMANSLTDGSIDIAGDVDWFRIEIPESGLLELQSLGSQDMWAALHDAAETWLISDNDDGEEANFLIRTGVAPGIYYLEVKHFNAVQTGAYQLLSVFKPGSYLVVSPATLQLSAYEQKISFEVESDAAWSWSKDADWILTQEPKDQSGNQIFECTINANASASARTGTITLNGFGHADSIVITQAAGLPGTFANTLVQTLPDGSQSMWIGATDGVMSDANLVTAGGIQNDAFDGAGKSRIEYRPDRLGSIIATNVWDNHAIPQQSGSFTASFTTIPGSGSIDTVIGFSDGPADFWTDIAAAVRFNPNGIVDARNGGAYAAVEPLAYSAGTPYLVEMELNVPARTYRAVVTPAGGLPKVIADNFSFRTEQSQLVRITNFASLAWTGGTQGITAFVGPSTPSIGSNGNWVNQPMTPMIGYCTTSFFTTLGAGAVDTVIGFSAGAADSTDDLAARVRFRPDGIIDAWDDGGFRVYDPYDPIRYVAGVPCKVDLDINVGAGTYTATVTPSGGSPKRIAGDFRFGPGHAGLVALDNLACLTATGGSQIVGGLADPGRIIQFPPLVADGADGPLRAYVGSHTMAATKQVQLVPGRHATVEEITLSNAQEGPWIVTFRTEDNYGSDGSTLVHMTTSGDSVIGAGDWWFVSSDRQDPRLPGYDPALMVSWRSYGPLGDPAFIQIPGGGIDTIKWQSHGMMVGNQSARFLIRRELFESAEQAMAEGRPIGNANANLSGLTTNAGAIAPAFSSDTTYYDMDVPYGVTAITVTPTTEDANASVTVNGMPVVSGSQSAGVELDAGINSIWITVTAEDGMTGKAYTLLVNRVPGPMMVVEDSQGGQISNGNMLSFGAVVLNEEARLRFTIRNTGVEALTGLGISMEGPHMSEFSVVPNLAGAELAPGASVNCMIRLSASGLGTRSASLHIASDGRDGNPFVIMLEATGSTAREVYLAALADSGLAGETAEPLEAPHDDGVANLLKYAFNMNLSGADCHVMPEQGGQSGLPLVTLVGMEGGAMIRVEYVRRRGSGLTYSPMISTSLQPGSFRPMTGGSMEEHAINDKWDRVVLLEPVDLSLAPRVFAKVGVSLP